MKVQIVDMSEAFCDSLKALLPDTMTVDICTDYENAFSRIVNFRPDILVLSAQLPGNDGLYLLQAVRSLGLRPAVLMVLLVDVDNITERIDELKIDDLVLKPCKMSTVASKVLALQDAISGTRTPTRSWIRNFLLSLDFQPNLCGYQYLFTTIELLNEDPNQPLTKALYPAAAKRVNGSWQQIEHGIRLSIEDAWEKHGGEMWNVYFPNAKERPSNSVFLKRAVQFLRRSQE